MSSVLEGLLLAGFELVLR